MIFSLVLILVLGLLYVLIYHISYPNTMHDFVEKESTFIEKKKDHTSLSKASQEFQNQKGQEVLNIDQDENTALNQWQLTQNLKALNYITEMESMYVNDKISEADFERYKHVKKTLRGRTIDLSQSLKKKTPIKQRYNGK
ncbi:hypothetical protein VOI54_17250 [Tamlana sp. 2201CG12-4]|uniref:hypothetical protein n=1 Tax=Tamlana sp. 2201CG12-4 TaxID=3112582 RepID=UPI002DBB107A|nr:hypothetical protein [Tamlana sp. 2201CG12-4]MEC3908778.1 hypothetical protein [Tamlana sp. 2201CG12-4]